MSFMSQQSQDFEIKTMEGNDSKALLHTILYMLNRIRRVARNPQKLHSEAPSISYERIILNGKGKISASCNYSPTDRRLSIIVNIAVPDTILINDFSMRGAAGGVSITREQFESICRHAPQGGDEEARTAESYQAFLNALIKKVLSGHVRMLEIKIECEGALDSFYDSLYNKFLGLEQCGAGFKEISKKMGLGATWMSVVYELERSERPQQQQSTQ